MPYLSALEVCSRRGAMQIHIYLYLTFTLKNALSFISVMWCCVYYRQLMLLGRLCVYTASLRTSRHSLTRRPLNEILGWHDFAVGSACNSFGYLSVITLTLFCIFGFIDCHTFCHSIVHEYVTNTDVKVLFPGNNLMPVLLGSKCGWKKSKNQNPLTFRPPLTELSAGFFSC